MNLALRHRSQAPRTSVGDAVFQLIDTEDDQKVEFGEFVQAVTTFCMFEPREILHFIFYIFDRERHSGSSL